ncbi:DBH-like monooxygenase protein 1 [Dreissena polymorpha]|uniref:DBH-like monooxygenase protein 1 n=1 Tax=Dreissena polymorpha TaxID=45954 RepID=UPI0022646C6E|nr:DBH-like monooxygenase protein 1 [Dreissena polymorpha]
MAVWMYFLLTYFLNVQTSLAQTDAPAVFTPVYDHYRALDYQGNFVLGWSTNATDIDIEITARTTGYVGLGLSPTGTMTPADMVIGWIADGQMYLGDYYTREGDRTPYIDVSQDWIVQAGNEVNGTTVLRFSRKLRTCDVNDVNITASRMSVIWSYHESDPNVTSGLMPYHGPETRGSRDMYLINDDVVPKSYPPPNTFMIDIAHSEYVIPAVGSSLQCRVFQRGIIPAGNMIKYEPFITPGNEAYVYRMTLYRCSNISVELAGQAFDCDEAPNDVKSCKTIVASWSMGAEAFHFPEGVGMSVGGPSDPNDYVLEIQYSKWQDTVGPDGTAVTIPDSSGLRVTYTTSAVQQQAGVLELGKVISAGWREFIPDGEAAFTTNAFCSPRCMNWGFSPEKSAINIFGVILKGNDVARDIKLRHFRGSNELPWIAVDTTFSNFFQAPRLLKNSVSVEATDTLSVQCTYNTMDRQGITRGGFSRVEEVCRATVMYYPAKQFDMCLSWSSFDQLKTKTGQLVNENEAVQYLQNVTTWDPDMKRLFKDALRDSSERTICSSIARQPAYAVDRYQHPATTSTYSETLPCY